MSRRSNNVRGPTSALTEFLRESGITPTTVARRRRTQLSVVVQPEAGPSNAADPEEGEGDGGGQEEENANAEAQEYDSDNLDEPEEEPTPKKRKLTKAAEAKLKAKEKAKAAAKAKKGKKGDDDDYEDEDEDPYHALSKMWKQDLPKPPVGSFEDCTKCGKQFTVTKYTIAANPGPGWLCHLCAKSSGADPFKKPALPRKRKAPADKRTVIHFEERRLPSLASLCIQLISQHIDDVEALGDIGTVNLDEIAKAISRNRSLTAQNVPLFYDVTNAKLTLYDVTNLEPPALCAMASLNPNLTHLRLDYCGRINDIVFTHWASALPQLRRLELLGPFLVRVPGWLEFIRGHPALEGFLITQSPRFDLDCIRALAETCKGLTELRLKEIGLMADPFLAEVKKMEQLTSLEISRPGKANALTEEALIELMSAIGPRLTHLDLSGNTDITDDFLEKGLKAYCGNLTSLSLANITELTDAGVAALFNTWGRQGNSGGLGPPPRFTILDLSRNHQLVGGALSAVLAHSGRTLTQLNINGWKEASQESLESIGKMATELRKVDIGYCREASDFVVKNLLEGCEKLEEMKVWGCQRLTEACPRKRNVIIQGVEAHRT